ncbi:MAG: PIG-L family deacetylase [Verrucomicrobia bacterium]|nr:PIG-L family deacetylase [Verrucomicrobiota bacterium]
MLAGGGLLATSLATGLPPAGAAEEAGESVPAPRRQFRIVVTGGHPGDPEYGCGGTIARLTALGHAVTLLYLNRGDPAETPGDTRPFPRVQEATRACEILKARPVFAGQVDGKAVVDPGHYERFRRLLATESPDAVFTHWPIDNHADHRAMFTLVYDAWRRLGKSFALFYYEVSNGEDTLQFAPTDYVNITATEPVKRRACYAHASQNPDHFYNLQETIARVRGIESGQRYAEAFLRGLQSPPFPLPA